jgi:hypothetical protein
MDVLRVDLLERAVSPAVERAPPIQPVGGIRVSSIASVTGLKSFNWLRVTTLARRITMTTAKMRARFFMRVLPAAAILICGSFAVAADVEVWTFDRLDRLGDHRTNVLGNPRVVDTPVGKAIEFDVVDDALHDGDSPTPQKTPSLADLYRRVGRL